MKIKEDMFRIERGHGQLRCRVWDEEGNCKNRYGKGSRLRKRGKKSKKLTASAMVWDPRTLSETLPSLSSLRSDPHIFLSDQNNGIVGSRTGSTTGLSDQNNGTINREFLKPSASVAVHSHSNVLVDVLPPESSQSEKPDVTYNVRMREFMQEGSQDTKGSNDAFSQVMGPKRHSQIRGYGLSPTSTEIWGSSSSKCGPSSSSVEVNMLRDRVKSLEEQLHSKAAEMAQQIRQHEQQIEQQVQQKIEQQVQQIKQQVQQKIKQQEQQMQQQMEQFKSMLFSYIGQHPR